jgi:hypothetical protein
MIGHVGGEESTIYFTPSTSLGSTITRRKIIGSSVLTICTSTDDNEALYKVSSLYSIISHLRRKVSAHKLSHTLQPSWIHHNSKKNYWILPSSQYAYLLIIMKHCTKFQVFMISRLGEVSTRKQYVSPRMGVGVEGHHYSLSPSLLI